MGLIHAPPRCCMHTAPLAALLLAGCSVARAVYCLAHCYTLGNAASSSWHLYTLSLGHGSVSGWEAMPRQVKVTLHSACQWQEVACIHPSRSKHAAQDSVLAPDTLIRPKQPAPKPGPSPHRCRTGTQMLASEDWYLASAGGFSAASTLPYGVALPRPIWRLAACSRRCPARLLPPGPPALPAQKRILRLHESV